MQKPIMHLVHSFDPLAGEEILEAKNEDNEILMQVTEDDLKPMETAGLNPYDHADVFAYVNHLQRDAFGSYEVIWESEETMSEFTN